MKDPRESAFDVKTTIHLDNKAENLAQVFETAIRIWNMMGETYKKLNEFVYFQSDPLSEELCKLRSYELWQEYAVDHDFEHFEMLLTFSKRVFFNHEMWSEMRYIELIRSEHYEMRAKFEKYRDSLPDSFWLPKW